MWLDHIAARSSKDTTQPEDHMNTSCDPHWQERNLFRKNDWYMLEGGGNPEKEKEAALLLAGLANRIIAATGYTAQRKLEHPREAWECSPSEAWPTGCLTEFDKKHIPMMLRASGAEPNTRRCKASRL